MKVIGSHFTDFDTHANLYLEHVGAATLHLANNENADNDLRRARAHAYRVEAFLVQASLPKFYGQLPLITATQLSTYFREQEPLRRIREQLILLEKIMRGKAKRQEHGALMAKAQALVAQ